MRYRTLPLDRLEDFEGERVAAAVGDGALAVRLVHRYLGGQPAPVGQREPQCPRGEVTVEPGSALNAADGPALLHHRFGQLVDHVGCGACLRAAHGTASPLSASQPEVSHTTSGATAIDLVDEACAVIRTEIDSMPQELDAITRRVMQLEIEDAALKKEKDKASKERLEPLRKELADLRAEADSMTAQWEAERQAIHKLQAPRDELSGPVVLSDRALRQVARIKHAQREFEQQRASGATHRTGRADRDPARADREPDGRAAPAARARRVRGRR